MRKICILLLLLSFSWFYSQGKSSLSSRIYGKNGQPMSNVTVMLMKADRDEVLKTTITDQNGNFEFEDFVSEPVKLVIEQTGYEKFISETLISSEGKITFPEIRLNPGTKEIEGVTITSKKPFVTQKIDRIVVNPDALISNAGTTALEVLEKTPSVSVDMNGNISMKSKSGVQVFIDDKPSYLSASDLADYLRSIPSSSIETIEVIANPPAKYDAAGNAGIINIRLKKNAARGFNGGINLAYGQGKHMRANNSANFNYRIKKWNFFSNFSLNKNETYQDLTITREYFTPNGDRSSTFTQNSYITPSSRTHSAKVGADFYATPKTTLGIVLSGFINPSDRNIANNAVIQNADYETVSLVEAQNPMKIRFKNDAINLNMNHKFTDKQELSVNFDHINYHSRVSQNLYNAILNPDRSVIEQTQMDSELPSDIRIKAIKADYSGVEALGGNLGFGAKSSFVKTNNVADFRDVMNGIKIPNYQFSNDFTYKENIHAVYTNYSKDFSKFSVQAGLRMEYSDIKGYQKGNPMVRDSAFSKKYTSLFPTFYVQYRADSLQNHVFGLSLGRRIDRPNYKDLNPFTYPMDKFTFYGGNPFLEPTFSYNAEFNYTWNKKYIFGLNYSYIDNLISETNEQRNNIYYSRPGNFAKQISYGVSFNGTVSVTKWWTLQCYTALSSNRFSSQVYTESLNDSKWNWVIMPTNQFAISKKWTAELSGQYQSAALSGQFLISPVGSVRAGISTKILKDKGTLKLNVSDIFYTNQIKGQIRNIQNANASWYSTFDSRVISLSFSYRFSKGENLKVRESGGSETEQERVKI